MKVFLGAKIGRLSAQVDVRVSKDGDLLTVELNYFANCPRRQSLTTLLLFKGLTRMSCFFEQLNLFQTVMSIAWCHLE